MPSRQRSLSRSGTRERADLPPRSARRERITPTVLVLGTLNIDRIWQVDRLPRAGETVLAQATRLEFGGKGANQAVAAARQGARVTLLGAVGDDPEGDRYRAHLKRQGINTRWLRTVPATATGTAHVYLDRAGENQIVVDRGANAAANTAWVRPALATLLPRTAVLLVQFEGDLDAAIFALRATARGGVRSVCNPSPVTNAFPWGRVPVHTVIANEHECAAIFDCPPAKLAKMMRGARQQLLQRFALRELVITRGASPTLVITAETVAAIPTLAVTPVDTVGAGDTFAGVYAAELALGTAPLDAIRRANCAAALATLSIGAQTGMPTRRATTRVVSQLA